MSETSNTENMEKPSTTAKSEDFEFKVPGIQKNEGDWNNRVLIFTPTTGLVRIEWVNARFGQIIPPNWSQVDLQQFLNPYVPLEFQLPDAQNLMAKAVVEKDYQWVLYIEHDNVLPPDAFVRINEYIRKADVPVVSGLYFTKGYPSEPILYRGRGNSYFDKWKMRDRVWVDGIPFGFRLEHASLIKAAWAESPEYRVGTEVVRRVFESPASGYFDEKKGGYAFKRGTSDLAWCSRMMQDGLFKKAGWDKYQEMKHPFLVDTNIFVKHIDNDGNMYPKQIPHQFIHEDSNYEGVDVID